MIIRGGIPKPFNGTAPAVPGAPLADANALAAFQFLSGTKTVWIRIVNGAGNALRLFPEKPPLDPALWSNKLYFELAASEAIEGMFELTDLWIAGVGGTQPFKGLLGQRVL